MDQGRTLRGAWRSALVALLVLSFLSATVLPPGALAAGDKSNPNTEVGLEAASWVLTVPYGAAKVVFAILGGVAGGLTYAFSGGNTEAAKAVWDTSIRGTYVITPAHLKGDKPVRFLGVPPEQDGAQGLSSPEPAPMK
jgi:hypothetical protein